MDLVEVAPTGGSHSATVIFFHGSGGTGPDSKDWINFLLGTNLSFKHIKIIYPTAPLQPYRLLGGQKSNIWFNRYALTIEAKEHRLSLASIYDLVNELIDKEVQNGIQLNRIIVGGFSMGGSLALHIAYHMNRNIAGAFVCSSFLSNSSIVYKSLKEKPIEGKLPELLMFHGDQDDVASPSWGQTTFDNLKSLQVPGTYLTLKNVGHELTTGQMLQIKDWINDLLPLLENDINSKL